MAHKDPGLRVNRPVVNITGPQLESLYARQKSLRREDVRAKQKIFRPPNKLRSTAIGEREIKRFHAYFSLEISEEKMRQLADYLRQSVQPLLASTIEANTRPSKVYRVDPSKPQRKTLLIARSVDLMAERSLIKRAIDHYYGVDSFNIGEIWQGDDYATSVHLTGRSNNWAQASSIEHLHRRLERHPSLLPPIILLGQVAVQNY